MISVNIAENLLHLRHEKGITQERLAEFLGVSKASVSKWENGVSLPDIMQLPRIAAFYGISIDELMGYEALLSEEEINKYYEKFAKEFAEKPFDETLEHVRGFIHQYYSCYPALTKMALLLMNHYVLAPLEEQQQILEEVIRIYDRVQEKCMDVNLCSEAALMQAAAELYAGKPENTIEKLKNRQRMPGIEISAEMLLVQAYQKIGQQETALECNQMVMFQYLIGLIQSSTMYLMSRLTDREEGWRIIERTEKTAYIFEVHKLHPNTWLQFQYAKALFLAGNGEEQGALQALRIFAEEGVEFVKNGLFLHGDSYFNRIDEYFKKQENQYVIPRNEGLILASVRQSLDHPAFAQMRHLPEFQKLLLLIQSEQQI